MICNCQLFTNSIQHTFTGLLVISNYKTSKTLDSDVWKWFVVVVNEDTQIKNGAFHWKKTKQKS